MRMKKIPVRMLAILLVCMTVLLSVCLELLSVPAMAAEEKAACYTVRIAHVEHGSIALKEDDICRQETRFICRLPHRRAIT